MSEYLVLDTSALMNGVLHFKEFDYLMPGCTVVITHAVLQELDRLKGSNSPSVANSVREATRRIKAFLPTAARINDNI